MSTATVVCPLSSHAHTAALVVCVYLAEEDFVFPQPRTTTESDPSFPLSSRLSSWLLTNCCYLVAAALQLLHPVHLAGAAQRNERKDAAASDHLEGGSRGFFCTCIDTFAKLCSFIKVQQQLAVKCCHLKQEILKTTGTLDSNASGLFNRLLNSGVAVRARACAHSRGCREANSPCAATARWSFGRDTQESSV